MRIRRATQLAATIATTAGLAMALQAAPAEALGRNHYAKRDCGKNWVASNWDGTKYWAETTKVEGNCAGTLSVALRRSDGHQMPRKYGTNSRAYVEYTPAALGGSRKASTGLHWGCNACGASTT